MDKELTISKWVLINRPKIPQMLQNIIAQIVCPRPKVWDFDEKRLHWASVVRVFEDVMYVTKNTSAFFCVIPKIIWHIFVYKTILCLSVLCILIKNM